MTPDTPLPTGLEPRQVATAATAPAGERLSAGGVSAPAETPSLGTRTLVLFLVLAAVLVYANALHNGFAMDDEAIIAANQRVQHLTNLRDIWLTPYWPEFGQQLGVYRPVIIFLFAIQWALGAGQPWVFHAVNVLLHAGVTVMVFLLLRRFAPPAAAGVGALVFAVHPLHVEAVANVVGQGELVTTAALVGACLVHASRPPGVQVGWGRRAALAGLYALGLFTKESAIVLPGLLVLLDFAQQRVPRSGRGISTYARAMAMPLLLLAAVFVYYSIVRLGVLEGAYVGEDTGPQLGFLKEHRLLNAFRAYPEFMRLLFFPSQLSADYSPAVILPVQTLTPMVGLGLFLLAGTILLALLTPWLPAAGLPAGWFLVGVSVVSNLVFPVGILVAERTLYLPSIAVAAVAAFAWQRLKAEGSTGRRKPLLLGAAAVVVLLGARTWTRNPDWASTSAVFTSIVRDRPESYRAQWALAARAQSSGDRFMATMHYEAAYRIYPHNSELLTEYAAFLLNQKRYARAVELLESGYRMHPRVMRTASMLAYAYLADGRFAAALPVIQRVDELGAPRAATMPMWAYAYERLGDPERSVAAWRVGLREPGVSNWRNWSFLARQLAFAGHDSAALAAASRAAELATDTAGRALVSRLADALRGGCYRPAAARAAVSRTDSGPLLPRCDSLGDWLHDLAPQSAKPLQNARPAVPPDSRRSAQVLR